MMLGTATTKATLQPPVDRPGTVPGKDAAYRTSFNSRVKDIDIPAGTKLRFRRIQPETAASVGWTFRSPDLRESEMEPRSSAFSAVNQNSFEPQSAQRGLGAKPRDRLDSPTVTTPDQEF
jgi:hypothetical protein